MQKLRSLANVRSYIDGNSNVRSLCDYLRDVCNRNVHDFDLDLDLDLDF